jgi:hypothetical protein
MNEAIDLVLQGVEGVDGVLAPEVGLERSVVALDFALGLRVVGACRV